MANNLSYQQARTIRKTKFTDLFVDQLAQKDTSVLGAVGKTLSLRTSARFKGYKEKFDPLNIARFLTFGSKLGPALYGKMMGRSQKDIDYFTNRTRAIKGGNNTADRIGPSKNDGMLGINEQLAKIYQFLKSSREDDTRQTELENNAEEELNVERERRHRELLETLRKLVGNLGGTTVTATATQDNSFLNSLWTKLKGLADVVESLKDAVVEIVKKLGIPLLSGLARLGRFGWLAATNPITAVIATGAYISWKMGEIFESMSDEQLQQMSETGDEMALPATIFLQGRTKANRQQDDEKLEKIRQLLKNNNAPLWVRYYGSQEDKRQWLRDNTRMTRKEADKLFGPSPTDVDPSAILQRRRELPPPPPPAEDQPIPLGPTGAIPTDQSTQLAALPTGGGLVRVQAPPSSGSNINRLSIDNDNTQMASYTPSSPQITTSTNTVVNSQNRNKSGLKPSQINVRNPEDTYQELITASA
jgi:hypothetical protein